LTEAKIRQDQAASGTGGRDARAEDIAIAQADVVAAKERALGIVDLPPEQVGAAKANLEAAEAGIKVADGARRACGKERVVTVTKTDGKEENVRTVTDPNCSDELDAANQKGVDVAVTARDTAFQHYKFLTDPAM